MTKLLVLWLCCVTVGCGKSAAEKDHDARCKTERDGIVAELKAARDSIASDVKLALPEEPQLIPNELGKIQFDDMTAMLAAYKHRRDLAQPTQQAIDAAIAAWSAADDRRAATTAVLEAMTTTSWRSRTTGSGSRHLASKRRHCSAVCRTRRSRRSQAPGTKPTTS